ncbi:methyltransferase domain-containing protein [Pseudomonas sp. WAC2]|uniref:class I SAM-dependent methyltransferase n=1 Tax=Pseudomonas sp. WAC2 TaxID=3055057 RepID=UPI00339D5AAC
MGDEPARSTLLRALDHWNGPTGVALDLGCGTARDTLELLARGWDVIAVDAQAEALERLSIRFPELHCCNRASRHWSCPNVS